MKKLISLILILSTPAYADTAIKVKTGDVVTIPFDQGTLLDTDKATKIKDQLINGDTCAKENESFQKSVDFYKKNQTLYQDENNLLLNQNIELNKSLNSAHRTSDWEKIGYIILGAGILYGASRLTR